MKHILIFVISIIEFIILSIFNIFLYIEKYRLKKLIKKRYKKSINRYNPLDVYLLLRKSGIKNIKLIEHNFFDYKIKKSLILNYLALNYEIIKDSYIEIKHIRIVRKYLEKNEKFIKYMLL